eukprot:g1657.t1
MDILNENADAIERVLFRTSASALLGGLLGGFAGIVFKKRVRLRNVPKSHHPPAARQPTPTPSPEIPPPNAFALLYAADFALIGGIYFTSIEVLTKRRNRHLHSKRRFMQENTDQSTTPRPPQYDPFYSYRTFTEPYMESIGLKYLVRKANTDNESPTSYSESHDLYAVTALFMSPLATMILTKSVFVPLTNPLLLFTHIALGWAISTAGTVGIDALEKSRLATGDWILERRKKKRREKNEEYVSEWKRAEAVRSDKTTREDHGEEGNKIKNMTDVKESNKSGESSKEMSGESKKEEEKKKSKSASSWLPFRTISDEEIKERLRKEGNEEALQRQIAKEKARRNKE